MANNKPTFPYQVTFVPLGHSAAHTQEFASPSKAIAFAVTQMQFASKNVGINVHNGEKWTIDQESTNKAMAKITGRGNQGAVNALTQLNEYTSMLSKQAGKQNGVNSDTARVWLEQFYRSCQALGIIPGALEQARNVVYNKPAEPASSR